MGDNGIVVSDCDICGELVNLSVYTETVKCALCSALTIIEPQFSNGQPTRMHDEEEERRQCREEFNEAGFVDSDESSTSNRSTSEPVEKRRRHGPRFEVGVFGITNRCGEREFVPPVILGERHLEDMVNRATAKGQRKLVRESIKFGCNENAFKEISTISESLFKKGTPFIVGYHGKPFEHYHIVHCCPWKWYTCRCYCPGAGKRTLKTDELSRTNTSDFQRIIEYLCSDERLICYLFSGVTYSRHVPGAKYIFESRVHRLQEFQGSLEIGEEPNQGSSRPDNDEISEPAPGPSSGQDTLLSKPCRNGKPEEIESMVMRHPCVPLSSFILTNIWLGSKFRFLDARDSGVSKAIKYIKSKLSHWTVLDFIKYYESDQIIQPLYSCIKGNFYDYYYNREMSKKIILDLIQFQQSDIFAFEKQSDEVGQTAFWNDIYNICNRTNSKRNCLELIGPQNCGKSYFANWLTEFFINVGHVANFSRFENFPLQSAYNARILNWGEAYAEKSKLDSVKLLLGGDPCPANIKYESTQTIEKTPVIITANKRLIPKNGPFNERMIRYDWKTCDMLKQYDKKPNPLAFIDILREYDII